MKIHLFCLAVLAACSVQAQSTKKVGPALSKFLNTEFMIKYRDLRIGAESAALQVQSNQALPKAEVYRLRTAYDQTAVRANQLLENIRQDFLNAKKLKSISEYPDMYSDGLGYKLRELADYYAANFQQPLADIAASDKDGSAVLLLVVELIGLTRGLAGYFAEIRREARHYTEAHLQENLVQPYRWRYWDELAGQASPYERFEKTAPLNLELSPADQKLDQQFQKFNQTITTLPAGADGQSTDPFQVPVEQLPAGDSSATFRYDDWTPTETPPAPAVRPENRAPAAAPPTGKKAGEPVRTPPARRSGGNLPGSLFK